MRAPAPRPGVWNCRYCGYSNRVSEPTIAPGTASNMRADRSNLMKLRPSARRERTTSANPSGVGSAGVGVSP